MGRSTLLTVGHSTLDRDDLGDLLTGAGIEQLVDIRRFPGSRHNPDARREALEQWLPARGVAYRWEERLGGRRRLTAEQDAASPDRWWRVAQFRAYAAGTRTEDFAAAMRELLAGAAERRTAVMCSEAVWWRCHRRIVADVAVLQHEVAVRHLMHTGRLTEHPVSEGARLTGSDEVVWDGEVAGT
ncbi:DUF488 domain-containing protein [Ornithinimicrobium sp. F0845]|uniref:DUF488 domain-containing protein n=1 Tax=Ornithinimicrobium sp. F0845 TaxID=2926412 RepID=UPI001FF5B820|nr:DUF488 domain-containing protein [Ornithinimicrobium sp. F0845]MCK0112392.1 DUF488 domain-containing protein [Ornithinimicrobium sp. F0845]